MTVRRALACLAVAALLPGLLPPSAATQQTSASKTAPAQPAAPPQAEPAEELDAGTDPSKSSRRVNVYNEYYKIFEGGTVFYVKPGFGLVDDPNNRDWGFEFGIRQKF